MIQGDSHVKNDAVDMTEATDKNKGFIPGRATVKLRTP